MEATTRAIDGVVGAVVRALLASDRMTHEGLGCAGDLFAAAPQRLERVAVMLGFVAGVKKIALHASGDAPRRSGGGGRSSGG
jgi:uncharacterized membrane protein YgcG